MGQIGRMSMWISSWAEVPTSALKPISSPIPVALGQVGLYYMSRLSTILTIYQNIIW